MSRAIRIASAALGLLLLAGVGSAQLVPLSRCRTAYPCAIPFQLEYRPDPLLASAYGTGGNALFSIRTPLQSTFAAELDRSRQVDSAAVDAAVKAFLRKYPAPKKSRPTSVTADPEQSRPGS